MKTKTKLTIGLLIVIAAICYLLFSGFSNVGVHAELEQIVGDPDQYHDKYVQTEGKIIGSTVNWDPSNVKLTFSIAGKNDPNAIIPVLYQDVMPDNFTDGTEVAVMGHYTSGNVFIAEQLTTKCPSKYENTETNQGK